MKKIFFGISIAALLLAGCGNSGNNSSDSIETKKSASFLPYNAAEDLPSLPKKEEVSKMTMLEKASSWYTYITSIPGKFLSSFDSFRQIGKNTASVFGLDPTMVDFAIWAAGGEEGIKKAVEAKQAALKEKETALKDGALRSALNYGPILTSYLKEKGSSILAKLSSLSSFMPKSAQAPAAALGADTSDIATRASRILQGVETSAFSAYGQMGGFYSLPAPVMVQLTGDEQAFSGMASVRVKDTVVGMIYSNINAAESSVLLSHSFNTLFFGARDGVHIDLCKAWVFVGS